MSEPTHISKHIDNYFINLFLSRDKKHFFKFLKDKYKAKTLDDIHIKMLNELEQEIYIKIINKKRGNNENNI